MNDEQIQSFFDSASKVVLGCVDLELADRWIEQAYVRLGYDREDPRTWEKDIVWMDHYNRRPVRQIAPRAWDALLDVIGGEERLEPQVMCIESLPFSTLNSFE